MIDEGFARKSSSRGSVVGERTWKASGREKERCLSGAAGVSNAEQWAVNNAVHYKGWANSEKKDFEAVVAAFKAFLACLRCQVCESWVHVTPRGIPESLRCRCNVINLNLKVKPK